MKFDYNDLNRHVSIYPAYFLLQLDVVGQNYISGVDKKQIAHTEVEHLAFSYDGDWLATVRLLSVF